MINCYGIVSTLYHFSSNYQMLSFVARFNGQNHIKLKGGVGVGGGGAGGGTLGSSGSVDRCKFIVYCENLSLNWHFFFGRGGDVLHNVIPVKKIQYFRRCLCFIIRWKNGSSRAGSLFLSDDRSRASFRDV